MWRRSQILLFKNSQARLCNDPLSMTGSYKMEVDSDPFAPPGSTTNKKVTITIPLENVVPDGGGPAVRSDPNDPYNWSVDRVIEWVSEHYSDSSTPIPDPDLIEAFRMGTISGKDLFEATPNSLFKEMRKQYRGKDYKSKVDEVLLRESALLCFKYGGQGSLQ